MAKKQLTPIEVFMRDVAHEFVSYVVGEYERRVREEGAEVHGEDPYTVLGVDPTDSPAVVQAVFKAKAKIFHPDNQTTGNADKFKRLQAARDAIMHGRPV